MFLPILLALLLFQEKPAEEPPAKKPEIVIVDPEAPKAEEEGQAPVEYTLNPVKAKKEMEVGNFYLRKDNYTAAIGRFREALKWDPDLPVAYFQLGIAYEKRGELRNAVESYQKYLELQPKGKKAKAARKAIARLERELEE